MKTWLLTLALMCYALAFGTPLQHHNIELDALNKLRSYLNLPQDEDLVIQTQTQWLRKPHQERWEMAELNPDQRVFVLNWAKDQGLLTPWKPTCKHYDQALILGATTPSMEKRLNYLKQLWDEGVRFDKIVWLTGDRPLDSRIDSFTDCCHNESQAASMIWEQTPLPEGMRSLPVVFVPVAMHVEGSLKKRPNTQETLLAWLQLPDQPHTALFISSQPFCSYQFSVIKGTLPTSILFDVVGPGVDPVATNAAVILDSVARWLYQEHLSTPPQKN